MASEPKIVQEIVLTGDEKVNQQFKKIADTGEQSFQQINRAAQQTSNNLQGIANSVRSAGQSVSSGFVQGARGAQELSSRIGVMAAAVTAAVGTVTLLGVGLLTLARNSATAASEIGASADRLGKGIQEYQEFNFILGQLGLTGGEADETIKKLGDTSEDAGKKIGKIGSELLRTLQASGQSFAPTIAGFNAMRQSLVQLASQQAKGAIPQQKLIDLTKEFQDEVDPRRLNDFAIELEKLIVQGKQLSTFGVGAGTTMRGVIDVIGDTAKASKLAGNEVGVFGTRISEFNFALKQLKTDATPENFIRFADALTQFTDESERTDRAVKALGERAGRALVRGLADGESQISKTLARFRELNLGVTEAERKVSDEFNAALREMGLVAQKGRIEIAQIFTPSLTQLITAYNTAVRGNRGTIIEWAQSIRDKALPAITDLIKLLGGATDDEIETKGLLRFRDALIEMGATAKGIFNEIIIPAVKAADEGLQLLLSTVNEFFGTNITPAQVGIVAVVTFLLGAIPGLIVALTALFTSTSPAMQRFRDMLKSIGIDIEQIKNIVVGFATILRRDLIALFEGRETDVQMQWLIAFRDILTSLPALIIASVAAIALLARGLGLLAPLVNRLFGTRFTAAEFGLTALLLQATGLLPTLTALLGAAAFASTLLLNSLRLVGLLLAGMAAVIGWPATLVIGLTILIFNLDKARDALGLLADVFKFFTGIDLRNNPIIGFIDDLAQKFAKLLEQSKLLRAAILSIPIFGTALRIFEGLGKGAEDAAPKMDELNKRIEEFKKVAQASGATSKQIEEGIAKIRAEFAKGVGQQNFAEGLAKATTDSKASLKEFLAELEKVGAQSRGAFGQTGQAAASATPNIINVADQLKKTKDALTGFAQSAPGDWQKVASGVPQTKAQIETLTTPLQRVKAAFDAINKSPDARDLTSPGTITTPQGATMAQQLRDAGLAAQQAGAAAASAAPQVQTLNTSLDSVGNQASEAISEFDRLPASVDRFRQSSSQTRPIVQQVAIGIDRAANEMGQLGDEATEAGQGIETTMTGAAEAATTTMEAVDHAVNATGDSVRSNIDSIIAALEAAIARAVQLAQEAAAAAAAAAAAGAGGGGGGGGSGEEFNPEGFARGGAIFGPGTGTSDSILARLSAGEYVQPAHVMRQPGMLEFMEYLRKSHGNLKGALDRIRGFALGGLVDSISVPRFATGGLIGAVNSGSGSMETFTLVVGGQRFSGLKAPTNVADSMRKASVLAQVSSAGRAPRGGG